MMAQWISAIDKIATKPTGKQGATQAQCALRQKLGQAAWDWILRTRRVGAEDGARLEARRYPEVEFHAMLVTFFSSIVLRFSTSCYGCHHLATDLRLPQQVSTIYPSRPAHCSFWGCLTHPEVEFDPMLVAFLSSFVLRFSTSIFGCHQLASDIGVSQQVSTIYPSKGALCSFWGCLPHPEVEVHARLVTCLSSSVLCVTIVYYGSHQLAPDAGVPQQVSPTYPSEPAICSF